MPWVVIQGLLSQFFATLSKEKPMELTDLRECAIVCPGVTFRVTLDPLDQESVVKALKKVGQQGYTKLNAVDEIDGMPVTIAAGEANCLVMTGVKSFAINTFAKTEGDVTVPVFTNSGGAIVRTMRWTAPNNMRVFLAAKARKDMSEKIWSTVETYLFCKAASAVPAGFYKLPLPNIYPDGRLCLGSGWKGDAPTLIGVLKNCLRQLNESSWNTDLRADSEQTKQLFRFHPATLDSLPGETDWWNACKRVNRVEYEALCD